MKWEEETSRLCNWRLLLFVCFSQILFGGGGGGAAPPYVIIPLPVVVATINLIDSVVRQELMKKLVK